MSLGGTDMAFAPFLVKAAVIAVKAFKAKTIMGSILRAGLQMGLAYGVNAVAGALSNQSVGRIDDGSQTTKWEPGTAIPRIYGGEGAGVDVTGIRLPPANVATLPGIRIDSGVVPYAYSWMCRATWTRSTNANENPVSIQIEWDDPSFSGFNTTRTVNADVESVNSVVGGTSSDSHTPAQRLGQSDFRLRVGFHYSNPNEILWSEWKRGSGTFTE